VTLQSADAVWSRTELSADSDNEVAGAL
jgi:hypothetical protein